jgi:EF hand
MHKHVLVLTTSALVLAWSAIGATAQAQAPGQASPGMPQGGMMGRGMMGMMGGGMIGPPPVMMRMIFTLMDTDGDGTISLQEFQAAHERIFKAIDANKDGRLTLEEVEAFMEGTRVPASQR